MFNEAGHTKIRKDFHTKHSKTKNFHSFAQVYIQNVHNRNKFSFIL